MDTRVQVMAMPDSRALRLTAALLFGGSAAVTLAWCGSMSAMPGMEMPGGWRMSMTWMRMPGQSWAGAATAFLGMWLVMMIAMMLPVLLPALRQYRRAIYRPGMPLAAHTLVVGAAYFGVWLLLGAVAFPVGVALAELAMRVPVLAGAVPLLAGLAVVVAGTLQLSKWKARQLDCCRARGARCTRRPADFRDAWRHGARLGLRCCYCCAPMTLVLWVTGVMDVRTMTAMTLAICAERLLPGGRRPARLIGAAMLLFGAVYLLC